MADILRQAEEKGEEVSLERAEEYAMHDVLGPRRDWDVGIGPTTQVGALSVARAQDGNSSSSSSQSRADPVLYTELQAQLAAQQAQMAAQQIQMEEMQRQLFSFTQMHTQASPTSPHPQPTPTSAAMADNVTPGSAEFHRDRPSGSGSGRGGSNSGRGGNLFGRGNSSIDKFYRQQRK